MVCIVADSLFGWDLSKDCFSRSLSLSLNDCLDYTQLSLRQTGKTSFLWATQPNSSFSVASLFPPLTQHTWITELFREYRPSYSDILPLRSVRGHSSGSSGATVKRSFSRFSGYRSVKAKAFNTVNSHRLFVWHWVLSDTALDARCFGRTSPGLNFVLFKNFTLMWKVFFF